MMNCTKTVALLSELHADALDEGVRVEVRTHLAECLLCADVYGDLRVIVEHSRLLHTDEGIKFPDEEIIWHRIQNNAEHQTPGH